MKPKNEPIGARIVFTAFFGLLDEGFAVAVDGASNAYLTGSTQSGDFPPGETDFGRLSAACLGSCGTSFSQDAFVIKIGP